MRENRVFLRKGKHPLLNFTTSRPRTIMCSSPHATFAFVQAEATSRQFRVWRGSTRDTSVAQRLARGRLYHIRFRSHRIVSVYCRVASHRWKDGLVAPFRFFFAAHKRQSTTHRFQAIPTLAQIKDDKRARRTQPTSSDTIPPVGPKPPALH